MPKKMRSQNWYDAARQYRERQIKFIAWKDIDDYIPYYHNFEIGDTLISLKDCEFSWGWSVAKNEIVYIKDNTSLWQLDFSNVNNYFVKVD